jgi:hypothetical protein
MIGNENLGSLMGAPVVGPDDDRIGTVGQVFVDPTTGSPNWVTVHTGLFGRHETFVPVDDADWDREVLHIPYGKGMVKDAPRIDTDEALDPRSEDELYRYYGIATVDTGEASDDNASTLPEESEPRQGGRLRKYEVAEEPAVARPDDSEPRAAESDSTASQNRKGRHRA